MARKSILRWSKRKTRPGYRTLETYELKRDGIARAYVQRQGVKWFWYTVNCAKPHSSLWDGREYNDSAEAKRECAEFVKGSTPEEQCQ